MQVKFAGKLLTTSLVLGGTLGALALVNKMTASQAGELNTVLKGEGRRYPWKYGDVFYQVKGNRESKPLLLIHGFAPGASSYEWRKNVDTLAEQFRVYTLDHAYDETLSRATATVLNKTPSSIESNF